MATLVNDIAVMTGNPYFPDKRIDEKTDAETRIRLMLIDSDAISISAMRTRLAPHRDFDVVAEASSGADALRKISLLRPDALLVDVSTLEACQLDGAELLSQPEKPLVVFLPTHRHYALHAYELGAAHCLVKPIRDYRFEVTQTRLPV